MTAQNPNLAALSAAGVSVWLDDLSRDRLRSGNLQELIDTKSVVGVTTNPRSFRRRCRRATPMTPRSPSWPRAAPTWMPPSAPSLTDDGRGACDVLVPQWEDSDGVDGRVSIEVDPRLAHETEKNDPTGNRAVEDRRPAEPFRSRSRPLRPVCPPSVPFWRKGFRSTLR
ncbi:transaldolase family protein [Mycobacterium tuberculosis]